MGGSDGIEYACNAGDVGLIPHWEDPLEKRMATTPVFLLGEFHRQRNPVGFSPCGCRESDMTEQLTFALFSYITYIYIYVCVCVCVCIHIYMCVCIIFL